VADDPSKIVLGPEFPQKKNEKKRKKDFGGLSMGFEVGCLVVCVYFIFKQMS
jgi:hypothetical protein